MILAAALTNIGMFVAEMSSDAWMVAGMADRGIIPSVLGTRNQHGTPTYGVLLSALGILCLSYLSFVDIIDMLNMIFCFAQAIEFIAFLYLRAAREDLRRPYRIPLSFSCLCAFLALPLGFIGVIIAFSSITCLIMSAVMIVLGLVLYNALEFFKKRQIFRFSDDVGSVTYTPIPFDNTNPVIDSIDPQTPNKSNNRMLENSGNSSMSPAQILMASVSKVIDYTQSMVYSDSKDTSTSR